MPGGRIVAEEQAVVTDDGRRVELSRSEAALLAVLARRPQQVFPRRELLVHAFDEAESEGTVDLYVHYCRRKLGHGVITTVRGLGYRLGPG